MGLLSLLVSLGVYSWLQSALFAGIACFFVGFISVNVVFLSIIAPAESLKRSKDLICDAIKDPSRIKSDNVQKVQLLDANGKIQNLGTRELGV